VLLIAFYEASAPSNFPSGTVITIREGQTLKNIGGALSDGHYIRSKALFTSFVTAFGGERHISPGDYYFDTPKNVASIAWQIALGRHNILPIKITIPEGENVREISQILAEKISGFDAMYFIKKATPHEGYLFPETYFFYPSGTPDSILQSMTEMFAVKTDSLLGTRKDRDDIVIVASLIEREAHGSDDRAIISGILHNRLDAGMPLQVDASVAYARGIPEESLSKSDLTIKSPYNTYLVVGLPPTPIANPGISALTASMNPAPTDYYYYLHDKTGQIHYARTYKEHQQNVFKYLK
jgi:UPF0755 protein